jgi:hypothetical protein
VTNGQAFLNNRSGRIQDNIIDVHTVRLRRKIDEGFSTKLVHRVRGVGFSEEVLWQGFWQFVFGLIAGLPLALAGAAGIVLSVLGINELVILFGAGAAASASFGLWPLFLFFLKVGSVLFGSGYVLLAASLILLLRFRINSTWLVLGGALVALLSSTLAKAA